MRIWTTLLLAFVLCSCRHSRVGEVARPLSGAVNRQYLIYVETIYTDTESEEERALIEARYAPLLQQAIQKRGYRAQLASSGPPRGISLTLRGEVTHYKPGAVRDRDPERDGPGSTRLYTSFTLENVALESVVAEFVVISTSGRGSDFTSTTEYIETHLRDGANKAAAYIANQRQ